VGVVGPVRLLALERRIRLGARTVERDQFGDQRSVDRFDFRTHACRGGPREGALDAGDDRLLLRGQIAPCAVGDSAEAIVETVERVLFGGAGTQLVEDAADLTALLVAGRALSGPLAT